MNTNETNEPKADDGTVARLAIQCIDPGTGVTGDWLFTGPSHRTAGSRVSPLFRDLSELFVWVNHPASEWREVAAGNAGLGFVRR